MKYYRYVLKFGNYNSDCIKNDQAESDTRTNSFVVCQVNAIKRCDSAVSQLSWLRHTTVHHITCLDNLCFPYADDSTATTPTIDVIFGSTPFYAAARRPSSRSVNVVARQAVHAPATTTTRPGFTFARNRREPTHFQWFGVTSIKPASQLLQLPPSALTRLVSRIYSRIWYIELKSKTVVSILLTSVNLW